MSFMYYCMCDITFYIIGRAEQTVQQDSDNMFAASFTFFESMVFGLVHKSMDTPP